MTRAASSRLVSPPIPVPISTPTSSARSPSGRRPAWARAWVEVAIANWITRSARRASLGSIQSVGSKSTTSAANRVRKRLESNRSMAWATDVPARQLRHRVATSLPRGVMAPIPVMTTLDDGGASAGILGADYAARHMKAVIFHRRGTPDVLSYEDVPDPVPGPGEVLVRMAACGLNHLDLHVREGSNGMRAPLPHIGGLEPAGTIAALGPEVSGWSVGDRVIVLAFTADGTCSFCLDGRENLCENREIIGMSRDGGFAEYLTAPASCLVRTPDRITDAEAAALPSAFGTAWHMLVSRAATKPGEWVLVLAAGSGIGSAAIQIARELGCTVIATAGSADKLEKARELGAHHVINHAETPRFEFEVSEDHRGAGRGRRLRAHRSGHLARTASPACGPADGW